MCLYNFLELHQQIQKKASQVIKMKKLGKQLCILSSAETEKNKNGNSSFKKNGNVIKNRVKMKTAAKVPSTKKKKGMQGPMWGWMQNKNVLVYRG